MYLDVKLLFEMLREVLGAIDGAVLATGATESDLQIGKIALNEALRVMIHEGIDGLQERQYLAVLLEEVNHRLIETREGLVLLVLTGVVRTAAVEDVSASVATLIRRQTFLERERIYRDGEIVRSNRSIRNNLINRKTLSQLTQIGVFR